MPPSLIKKSILIASVAACLIAIWPLPGTIALRQFFLLIGFFFCINTLWEQRRILLERRAWPLWMLMGFYIWLLAHYLFFATNIQEQSQELRGDWLRSFIATIIGLGLGLTLEASQKQSNAKKIDLILFLGFSGTVAIFFLRYLHEVQATGIWVHENFFMTPFKAKTPIVIFGAIFLPLAFLKILQVIRKDEKPAWLGLALPGILLTVFADYFANTKNGFLMFGFVIAICLLSLLKKNPPAPQSRRLPWLLALVLLLFTALPIKRHIESNPAWSMLLSDIKIGIDINNHEHWKNRKIYPMPVNEHGIHVNGSTYERTAWATAGLQLIKENPQGYGLIHHSFGALAIEKWSDFEAPNGKTRGATHSGWIDFTLGLGIPGLLLIFIPLCTSFVRSLRKNGFWYDYVRWAVPTVIAAYAITEVSSDHFIELLFFLTAMFVGLTIKKSDQTATNCISKDSAR